MISEEQVDKNKELFLSALKTTLGVVTTAAQKVNMNRDSHYRWMKEDQNYKEKVIELENLALDSTESALYKNIQDGKEASIFFHLKCKGKKRGWIERDVSEEPEANKPIIHDVAERLFSLIKKNTE